jgi:protein kinase A
MHYSLVQVADWGFAKVIDEKTYTLCGSPEYLAPETVRASGQDRGVDLWALGILMYELSFGFTPFVRDQYGDSAGVARNILSGEFSFPALEQNVSLEQQSEIEDVISRLLQRVGESRIGYGDIGELQAHSAFQAMDWDSMRKAEVEPPWVPTLSSSGNCDEQQIDPRNFQELNLEDVRPIEAFEGDSNIFDGF